MGFRMKLELRKQKQNKQKCNQTFESMNCLGLPYAPAQAPIEQAFKGQPHAIVTHNSAGHSYFLKVNLVAAVAIVVCC